MRIILLFLVLAMACGTAAVKPGGGEVSVDELSTSEWTEVSPECYADLVKNPEVVGMVQSGRYMLQLVERY